MAAFETVSKQVTKVTGNTTLHHVLDLASAKHCEVMSIVKMRNPFPLWFWKKPKMIPTMLSLRSVLTKPDDPGLKNLSVDRLIVEKFKSTPTLHISGELGGKLASEFHLDTKTTEEMKVTIELGDIIQSSVNLDKLNKALESNGVQDSHQLFKELSKETRTELCVVLECLSTKGEGDITQDSEVIVTGDTSAELPKIPKTKLQIDATAKGKVDTTKCYSYEVPPGTVLAFCCNKIDIDGDGKLSVHTVCQQLDDHAAEIERGFESEDSRLKAVSDELEGLISSDKLQLLKGLFKEYATKATDFNLEGLHLLLSATTEYIGKNKTERKPVAIYKAFLGQESIKTWSSILEHIGFGIPASMEQEGTFIESPAQDPKDLILACDGLVDALASIPAERRKTLVAMPAEQQVSVCGTIAACLNKKEGGVAEAEEAVNNFLHGLGFAKVMRNEQLQWNDEEVDEEDALDAYTVAYLFSK